MSDNVSSCWQENHGNTAWSFIGKTDICIYVAIHISERNPNKSPYFNRVRLEATLDSLHRYQGFASFFP